MRWLHFSDFHIGGKAAPQTEALRSLLDYVSATCTDHVDAIVLAGDIAFSGQPHEYDRFERDFLKPLLDLSIARDARVFAVPGNHDIDCDAASPITWDGIKERNQLLFFAEDDDGRHVRKHRAPVFAAYQDFVQRNGILSPNAFNEVSLLVPADDRISLDVLMVNTAFFCDKEEHSDAPIQPCPIPSLRERLRKVSGMGPLLVIGHHPPTAFMRNQQGQFESLLVDNHAVYLHGHEHAPTLTANPDGSLRVLGFGAGYLTPLGATANAPYRNSFALCKIDNHLLLRSFSWDSQVGRWDEYSRSQFPAATKTHNGRCLVLNVPRKSSSATGESPTAVALEEVRRRPPIPQGIALASQPSDKVWVRLLGLSDTIRENYSGSKGLKLQSGTDRDGKREMIVEADKSRDLVVCIPAASHVLSAKEIESYNTVLDTEGYRSVTVLSLGKIASDAKDMYSRLRTRKAIEVLVNKDLALHWQQLLSAQQVEHLGRSDAAKERATMLVDGDTILLLLVDGLDSGAFRVMSPSGEMLPAHHQVVSTLRAADSAFARMKYSTDTGTPPAPPVDVFSESDYLRTCYNDNNVMKYAALANVGVRFSEVSLDRVYIDASASEVDRSGTGRLQALLDDHLAPYADSGLREEIKAKLLERESPPERQETSRAREYCQKYGAVLLTGDPGSGKTCFVKSEMLAYAARAVDNPRISADEWHSQHVPLLIPLSQAAGDPDLSSGGLLHVASRILERRGINFPRSAMETLLRQGRLALFFDGLDEVVSVERRAVLVQLINDMVTASLVHGNRFVVTSRPAAVNVVNLLPALRKLELQGLGENEIRTLATRVLRFRLEEQDAGVVLGDGHSSPADTAVVRQIIDDCRDKRGVARLAQNPLLLTLLVMIYANAGAPSAKRHRIYDQAIKTLVSVRGRQTGHDPVSAQDLRDRLGAVALSVYRRDSGVLPTRAEVTAVVRGVMTRQRGVEVPSVEAALFIQRVAESTGVIAFGTDDGQGEDAAIVTFMHHSFMEYFAAVGLNRELSSTSPDIAALVAQPRWEEVLTLLAGLIGETEDVAPILARFVGSDGGTFGDVDAKRLIFALDCALECEVPSDAALRLLAQSITKCLQHGPARRDHWVRAEIGSRLAELIAACGVSSFEGVISDLIGASDPELAGAAISLAAHSFTPELLSPRVLSAVESSCQRTEEPVRCAICQACARLSWLRTPVVRQLVGKCLQSTSRSRVAAFESVLSIPGLAAQHWPEIINGLDDKSERLRRLAAQTAIQAGLDGDLATLNDARKDLIARAFQSLYAPGQDIDHAKPRIGSTTVDALLRSPLQRDRLIGIQLIPAAEPDGKVVFDRLTQIISTSDDHAEVSAALRALGASRDALVLLTTTDLKPLAKLSKEGRADVRKASIHFLSHFVADPGVVEVLLDRDLGQMESSEYAVFWYALGRAETMKTEVVRLLERELGRMLADNVKRSPSLVRDTLTALGAAETLCRALQPSLSLRVRQMVTDFRTEEAVRHAALRAYPAVATPSRKVVDFLTEQFQSPEPATVRQLVHTPGTLAKHCRQSMDFVIACVDSMGPLREAASALHKRLTSRALHGDLEESITTLREGLHDLSEIIVTFEQFISPSRSQSSTNGTASVGLR